MSDCLMCGCGQFTALFHGSDRLYHTTTKQFSVVRCDECGLLRLDPTPPPDFDKFAEVGIGGRDDPVRRTRDRFLARFRRR